MLDFLKKYQNKGVLDGVCQPYLKGLLRCQSRKSVVDLFLSAQGAEFISQTIARGVVTNNEVMRDFGMFEGGRYVFCDGYSSAFHVDRDFVEINTTLAMCVDCGTITIPNDRICELHVIGDSKIVCKGAARVYTYNGDGTSYKTEYGRI